MPRSPKEIMTDLSDEAKAIVEKVLIAEDQKLYQKKPELTEDVARIIKGIIKE